MKKTYLLFCIIALNNLNANILEAGYAGGDAPPGLQKDLNFTKNQLEHPSTYNNSIDARGVSTSVDNHQLAGEGESSFNYDQDRLGIVGKNAPAFIYPISNI